MQIKPQTVEAVLFFNDAGICKEMLYPEFEALLDGMVSMPEFADQQMRVAYVLVSSRLQIRAAVFFYLDFNEDGSADDGWNIPLRSLAERTGRGPDLGAGPIRLACRSQCPVSWHQMHLWDPELSSERNHLFMLRDRIRRNQLGLLVEEDLPPVVSPEHLQVVAEETWYAKDAAKARRDEKLEQEQRLKAAQLIKQQRLRITNLERQREIELSKLREIAARQQARLEEENAQLRRELLEQEQTITRLRAELAAQVEDFQSKREEMSRQLRELEHNSRVEAEAALAQFDRETQIQVAAAVAEYQEQISIRDVELAYRNDLDNQLQEEIEELRKQCQTLTENSGERVLRRLAELGVQFVAYHPGAGHLTVAPQDLARYQQDPQGYAAAKCGVSDEQYRQWVQHYQQPSCVVALPSGERCDMPLDKVDSPNRFVIGVSNCCARHRSQDRLRTGS